MAETMQFELVSPERRLASREAGAVVLPGQMGELTAMPGHALFFTTLRPGFVTVDGGEGGRYFVTGGFAEIGPEALSVLAERAVDADEVTDEWIAARIGEAEKALEEAGDDRKIAVAQVLNDYRALAERSVSGSL